MPKYVRVEKRFDPLHLSGYGVKITVQDLKHVSALRITNGREDERPPISYAFRPRRAPFSSIMIEGHSGYVSLQAFHWLSRNRIPLFMMNFDGTIVSSLLPKSPPKSELRHAQFQASTNPETRFKIARALVQGKVARTIQVLEYLTEVHDLSDTLGTVKKQSMKLDTVATVDEVRMIEAQIANRYWGSLKRLLPDYLVFHGRHYKHVTNASDPVNSSLNYGYGILEGECMKVVNDIGLDSTVGFLHSFYHGPQTRVKHSLVYDLEEPFRWLVDLTVMEMFTGDLLGLKDFYFTGDDYRYRFTPEARQRFIQQLVDHFRTKVRYNGLVRSWVTIIEQKTRELGDYISNHAKPIDFTEPAPMLESPQEVA